VGSLGAARARGTRPAGPRHGRRGHRRCRLHRPVGRAAPGRRWRHGPRARSTGHRLWRLGPQRGPGERGHVGHAFGVARRAGAGVRRASARTPGAGPIGGVRPDRAPQHRLRGRARRHAALRGGCGRAARDHRARPPVAGPWRAGGTARRRHRRPAHGRARLQWCAARPARRHDPAAGLCAWVGARRAGGWGRAARALIGDRAARRGHALAPDHHARRHRGCALGAGLHQRLQRGRRPVAGPGQRARAPAVLQPRHAIAHRRRARNGSATAPRRLGHAPGADLVPSRRREPPGFRQRGRAARRRPAHSPRLGRARAGAPVSPAQGHRVRARLVRPHRHDTRCLATLAPAGAQHLVVQRLQRPRGTVFGRELARLVLGQQGEDDMALPVSPWRPVPLRRVREAGYELGARAVHLTHARW